MPVTIKRGSHTQALPIVKSTTARAKPIRTSADRIYGTPPFSSREVQAEVRKLRERVTASPKAADDFLKAAGILTPTGRLSKRYGG